jgi:hypothetical protein
MIEVSLQNKYLYVFLPHCADEVLGSIKEKDFLDLVSESKI